MNRERIRAKAPRRKPRLGVMPTMVQQNRKRYSRKVKHKNRGDGFAMGGTPIAKRSRWNSSMAALYSPKPLKGTQRPPN